MPAFDITQSDQVVKHDLGTRDLIVQAWQNGHAVHTDVAHKSDDELRVFTIGVSEKNPLRLLVFPIDTGDKEPAQSSKSSKEKSSATKKNTGKAKSSRSTGDKSSKAS